MADNEKLIVPPWDKNAPEIFPQEEEEPSPMELESLEGLAEDPDED